jgi:HlyD family secretion protein
VPTSAIAQGDRVLVVVDGRLEERTVTTGLGNWRSTEVTAGLSEGELVVTARNRPEIVAGALVELEEQP